jgi:putative SOS response-associated peptidase YedK
MRSLAGLAIFRGSGRIVGTRSNRGIPASNSPAYENRGKMRIPNLSWTGTRIRQQYPYWARDASIGFKTINAMSETAAEKPAFRDAMRRRRCLIPADSFYEWAKVGPRKKQPYNFGMIDESLFAFAGLWEHWRDPVGAVVETCTILTTQPNGLVAQSIIECR